MGIPPVKFDKPFKTYEEQIVYLHTHYKLKIYDDAFAKSALSTVSYYDLINGYQECMMENGQFKSTVSMEYLFYFYLFDKDFQDCILKFSLLVENIFKNKMAYVLAKNHGVLMYDYLAPYNFKARNNDLKFSVLHGKLTRRLDNDRYQPLYHYLHNHNHIPPWILFKNTDFGNVTDLYRLMKIKDKEEVANLLLPDRSLFLIKFPLQFTPWIL